MRACGVWLIAAGCSFQAAPEAAPDAAQPSQAIDAPASVDAVGPCTTFSALADTCTFTLNQDLMLNQSVTFDTDAETLNGAKVPSAEIALTRVTIQGIDVEVILAHDVTLSAGTLRVIGSRPLAVIASGTVAIGDHAAIDVSAGGAGARTSCTNGAATGLGNNSGSGGGGGGGFAAPGGEGGFGASGFLVGGAGGAPTAMPSGLHGGCPGAQGGHGTGAQGGPLGRAGGAIYLAAATSITLGAGASINAGGEGGHHGGHTMDGGGGGGSGGMIFLDAPRVITTDATLAANGGGGGGGNDRSAAGLDGGSGQASFVPALGGDHAKFASAGGTGGTVDHAAGFDVRDKPADGGGGGGGSVGFIRVRSSNPALGTTSPAAITP